MARDLAITSGDADGAAWPGLVAALQREGRPRLVVQRLTGGSIAVGRYQRAASALTDHARSKGFQRRVTGGRAIALGEGMFGVALVLPHRGWLAGDEAEAVPTAKLLNRSVRGLLSGLGRLGVGATYFGRDFVTVDSAQAAYLTFDVDAAGHAVVECVLPAEAHWWLPADCDAQPRTVPERGFPAPATIERLRGVAPETLLDALVAGFADRSETTSTRDDRLPPPGARLDDPPELERGSAPRRIAAGFLEARATMHDGVIAGAGFRGDFLGDSAGLRTLEAALAGAAPTLEAIGPRLNAVYADAAHTLLGADLDDLANALLEACR